MELVPGKQLVETLVTSKPPHRNAGATTPTSVYASKRVKIPILPCVLACFSHLGYVRMHAVSVPGAQLVYWVCISALWPPPALPHSTTMDAEDSSGVLTDKQSVIGAHMQPQVFRSTSAVALDTDTKTMLTRVTVVVSIHKLCYYHQRPKTDFLEPTRTYAMKEIIAIQRPVLHHYG